MIGNPQKSTGKIWKLFMDFDSEYGDMNRMVEWARTRERKGRCILSLGLRRLYGLRVALLRRTILRACNRLEGGPFFSQTLREILADYHGVTVGKYSYGPCLVPGYLPHGTRIGNYCSIAEGLAVYHVNHTIDRISQHPFFFNSAVGLLKKDAFEIPQPLVIGHDVWIGRDVILLPKCRRIGDGAVVGAGSVVTRDVEPFTIVGGNPAKVIRRRLPDDVACRIRESEWWRQPLSRMVTCLPLFMDKITLECASDLAKCVRSTVGTP